MIKTTTLLLVALAITLLSYRVYQVNNQLETISQQLNVTNCTLLNDNVHDIHKCVMDIQD